MSVDVRAKLAELGLELPVAAKPVAAYLLRPRYVQRVLMPHLQPQAEQHNQVHHLHIQLRGQFLKSCLHQQLIQQQLEHLRHKSVQAL